MKLSSYNPSHNTMRSKHKLFCSQHFLFVALAVSSILFVCLWFFPWTTPPPQIVREHVIILWTRQGCAACEQVTPAFHQLQDQYPQVSAVELDIDTEASLWKKLQTNGFPENTPLPFLVAGNQTYASPKQITPILQKTFLAANTGRLERFQGKVAPLKRFFLAMLLAVSVCPLLFLLPSFSSKNILSFGALLIGGIAIWQSMSTCAQCESGDSPSHKFIAIFGVVVYLTVAFLPSTRLSAWISRTGGWVAVGLLASQCVGLFPACPPCIAVDLLAIAISRYASSEEFPAFSTDPTILLNFLRRRGFTITLLASGYITFAIFQVFSAKAEQQWTAELGATPPPLIGSFPPPTKDVLDASGHPLDLNKLKGKPLVIIWGDPDCRPCQQAKSSFNGVNDVATVLVHVNANTFNTPTGWYSVKGFQTARKFGFRHAPTITILAPDGSILLSMAGITNIPVYQIAKAALRKNKGVLLSNGFDDELILVGKDTTYTGTTQTYLPRWNAAGWRRIQTLQHSYPSLKHIVYCDDPRALTKVIPNVVMHKDVNTIRNRFRWQLAEPRSFAVDQNGYVIFYEQKASSFRGE